MLKKKIIDTVKELQFASQNMPKVWDSRKSILEMKEADFGYWRQIEWIDFYFKFLCQKHFASIIDIPGKKYGITRFDAFREISWDFRMDSVDAETYSIIANDIEAITDTMSNYGYYGIILAVGTIEYDDKETSFKKWHDGLRGEVSKYDTYKINNGIMSRTRKRAFTLEEIHFICFNGEVLHQCCSLFQDCFGETDSDRPKPKEVRVDVGEISDEAFVTTKVFRKSDPINPYRKV